jgi:hypothetical protein
MTNDPSEPMSDDLDLQLIRLFRARAESAPGLATASEMTARLAGRRRSRSIVSPRLAWALLVLATLLALAAVFGSGSQHQVVVASPSPTGPITALASPTAAPSGPRPTRTPDVSYCTTNRTVLQTPDAGTKVPSQAEAFRAPAGTRMAAVLFESDSAGAIVVVGPAGKSTVIATFTGTDFTAHELYSWVTVSDWSSDGAFVLVTTGHRLVNGLVACDNLWLVSASGSSVEKLTDNGPRVQIDAAAFASTSASVAYFQHDYGSQSFAPNPATLNFVVDGTAGAPISMSGCPLSLASPRLVWSPDDNRVAILCADSVGIVDVGTRYFTTMPIVGQGRWPLALKWTSATSLILAATDGHPSPSALPVLEGGDTGNGPIVIEDVDINKDEVTDRVSSDYQTTWNIEAATFSPDGRWLIAVDGLNSATYLIDTESGASTKLPWPHLWQHLGDGPVVWLPGSSPRVIGTDLVNNGPEYVFVYDLLGGKRQRVSPLDWAYSISFRPD